MIRKIVITGPGSTGKTTLTQQLAAHYNTEFAEEIARRMIEEQNNTYKKEDLVMFAEGQVLFEEAAFGRVESNLIMGQALYQLKPNTNRFVFMDTDLITIKIWSEYKYGDCDEAILQQIEEREYDGYLLCGIDVPWEADPQRENPHDRAELYERYKQELIHYNKNFIELTGDKDKRFKDAVRWLISAF